MFKGYCVSEDGFHTPPVDIYDASEAWIYVRTHKGWSYEVKIVDKDDYIVLHARKGEIVFPTKEDCDKCKR